jgi:hypothetical protein
MKNNESRAMKEIHEIREQISEENKGLTPEERAKETNRIGTELAAKYGLKVIQKV